jgi:hypothetical protein
MDFNALQRKLFEMDPSDPREDLAKLAAQASGSAEVPAAPQPITESYEVPEGSLQMDREYSVSDFAALAGVKLTEAPVQQPAPAPADQAKLGQGAKMVGQKIGAKGGASQMAKALDKVAQGGALPANLSKQIAPFAKQLEVILSNQQMRTKFMQMIKQAEAIQKKQAAPAAEPQAQAAPQQGQPAPQESIREELERRLKEFKSGK